MNVMRLMFFLCNINFCRCLNWAYPNIISPCRIYNDENVTLLICIFGGFSYCGSFKVYHDYIYKTPGKEKNSGFMECSLIGECIFKIYFKLHFEDVRKRQK